MDRLRGALYILPLVVAMHPFLVNGQIEHFAKDETASDSANGLRFRVEASTESVASTGTLVVDLILTNISDKPLTVFKDFVADEVEGSIVLSITDRAGRSILMKSDGPDSHCILYPQGASHYQELAPGASIRSKFRIFLKYYLFESEGEYSITVWYRCPASREKLKRDSNVWAKEEGVLKARVLQVSVFISSKGGTQTEGLVSP